MFSNVAREERKEMMCAKVEAETVARMCGNEVISAGVSSSAQARKASMCGFNGPDMEGLTGQSGSWWVGYVCVKGYADVGVSQR